MSEHDGNPSKEPLPVSALESTGSVQTDQDAGMGIAAENKPGEILLITHPDPRSFIYKYTLACVPILLVVISVFIRTLLEGVSSSVIHSIPGMFSSAIPTATTIAGISVYLVAPVGIFIVVAGIGWTLRFAELWTGTMLALLLSVLAGFLAMTGSGSALLSERYVGLLLRWIAFFIQIFSVIAVLVVLVWIEKFRRSITYEIRSDCLKIRGGVWKIQEHILPHHQIARIILEQDYFGRSFNYGTVIPQSLSLWGAETSIRGVGAGGQKDNLGAMIGFAKGRAEASRTPLDCFYGIPDPQNAQGIMKDLIMKSAACQEEQVRYLKEISEKI